MQISNMHIYIYILYIYIYTKDVRRYKHIYDPNMNFLLLFPMFTAPFCVAFPCPGTRQQGNKAQTIDPTES